MPRRIAYVDRSVAEVIARTLSTQLLPRYGSPMPAFTILGPEGENGLQSALALPRQPYYRGLLRKAAALFRSLVKNHPFIDGNKRFGLAALHFFLLRNGWVLLSPHGETVDFALRVASEHDIGLSTIERWLKKHCCPLKADDTRLTRFAASFPGDMPALKKEIGEVSSLLDALTDTVRELRKLSPR